MSKPIRKSKIWTKRTNDYKKLYQAYNQQRWSATKVRGIEWKLTFDEWYSVWVSSNCSPGEQWTST